jgi:hypothetical protein
LTGPDCVVDGWIEFALLNPLVSLSANPSALPTLFWSMRRAGGWKLITTRCSWHRIGGDDRCREAVAFPAAWAVALSRRGGHLGPQLSCWRVTADGEPPVGHPDHATRDGSDQEYSAACHIVRRYPRGPHWSKPRTWKYLKPQPTWPWPNARMSLFLVALWWPDAQPSVDRRLRRLLHDRHRHPNINFLIGLSRQDLIPGSDISNDTAILCRDLEREEDKGRWVATVELLRLLNPTMAIAELEKLIRFPGPTIKPLRRFDAVECMDSMKHDSARVAKNLTFLAESLTMTGTPQDWYDTALRISRRDPKLGRQTMLRLADTSRHGRVVCKRGEGCPFGSAAV